MTKSDEEERNKESLGAFSMENRRSNAEPESMTSVMDVLAAAKLVNMCMGRVQTCCSEEECGDHITQFLPFPGRLPGEVIPARATFTRSEAYTGGFLLTVFTKPGGGVTVSEVEAITISIDDPASVLAMACTLVQVQDTIAQQPMPEHLRKHRIQLFEKIQEFITGKLAAYLKQEAAPSVEKKDTTLN